MRIFLIGPMGSGKTTVGRMLAERLQLPFFDLDRCIEESEGLSIATMFQQKGEAYFRQRESAALHALIQTTDAAVIATGGGTPCFFDHLEVLNSSGVTIYLQCSKETLQQRIEGTTDERPLLRQHGFSLEQLLFDREPIYMKATYTVSNDNGINSTIDAVLPLLQRR